MSTTQKPRWFVSLLAGVAAFGLSWVGCSSGTDSSGNGGGQSGGQSAGNTGGGQTGQAGAAGGQAGTTMTVGGAAGQLGGAAGQTMMNIAGNGQCPTGLQSDPVIPVGDLNPPEVLNGDIHLTFDDASDLTDNFFVPIGASDVSVVDGALHIANRKYRTLVYDTTPDETASDSFEDFRIAFRFMADLGEHVPPAGLQAATVSPQVWVGFFPQNGRQNAARVELQWSEVTNDNLRFITGGDFAATNATQNGTGSGTVTIGTAYPGPSFYTFTLTVKRSGQQVEATAVISQHGHTLIQGQNVFSLGQASGEIAIGGYPLNPSTGKRNPLIIDDIVIHRGAVDAPEQPVTAYNSGGTDANNYKMYLPPNVQTVKGIVYHAVGSYMADREYNRRFADLHDLAMMGGAKDTTNATSIANAIADFANQSGHAELNDAPLLLYGYSNGTRTAMTSIANNASMRGRILAMTPDSLASVTYYPQETWSAPILVIKGEMDEGWETTNQHLAALSTSRQAGGHTAFINRNRLGHNELGAFHIMFPFFDGVIRGIHADGQMPFEPVDESQTWLMATTGWNMNTTDPVPMPAIVPADGFSGNVGGTGWFIDKDSAFTTGAFVAFNRLVALSQPPYAGKVGDDKTVQIRVADAAAEWTKIELYDRSTLVETIVPCDPLDYTYADLAKGMHSFIALIYVDGEAFPSYPVSVVIN